jgi:hypothetical protein
VQTIWLVYKSNFSKPAGQSQDGMHELASLADLQLRRCAAAADVAFPFCLACRWYADGQIERRDDVGSSAEGGEHVLRLACAGVEHFEV